FSVVGTHAEVKCLTPDDLRAVGVQVMLSNGYHLLRRAVMIDAAGGLAEFNGWSGPTMTDSGGFQVMSLGSGLGKIISMKKENPLVIARSETTKQSSESKNEPGLPRQTSLPRDDNSIERNDRLAIVHDDGVEFRNPWNGRIVRFTPEMSMRIQHQLGSDMMMAFDELTNISDTYQYNVEALERTRTWAERSLAEHVRQTNLRADRPRQALFGVLQGAHYQDLREKAAHDLASMRVDGAEFDGFGLGGAFEKERLGEILSWMTRILPEGKPRHLLGLGRPDDIFIGVENGCDTFDCVAPTREARHGRVYTLAGDINLRRSEFADDGRPLDEDCDCPTCNKIAVIARSETTKQSSESKNEPGLPRPTSLPRHDKGFYSRAELRVMLKSPEPDEKARALALLSQHNVRFIVRLTEQIRAAIIDGTFSDFKNFWLERYRGTMIT
ncbi:tRNA-guanine transglycosylase, partial [Candidatus Saccharibacteria bacterium]|nr:tRNA-guanine transglycosylase [Candidatus Saccharibacteria bacterium]